MPVTVKFFGVATAEPDHVIQQADAAAMATHLLSKKLRGFRRLAPVFENAGIRTRYSVRPLSWFYEPHCWSDRMDAYAEGVSRLFVNVTTGAIQQAGLTARDIDTPFRRLDC